MSQSLCNQSVAKSWRPPPALELEQPGRVVERLFARDGNNRVHVLGIQDKVRPESAGKPRFAVLYSALCGVPQKALTRTPCRIWPTIEGTGSIPSRHGASRRCAVIRRR